MTAKAQGPLVTQLSKSSGSLEVPIVIVPGSLSKEQLQATQLAVRLMGTFRIRTILKT